MIVVSQDGMLFVNLDRISCVKILHRGPGLLDILAINNGNSERLGSYMSEDDAKKVLSNILAKRFSKWRVMFMPDRLDVENIRTLPMAGDRNEHTCSTCIHEGGETCLECQARSMWETKGFRLK